MSESDPRSRKGMRLQKYLSRAGVASRRAAERLIAAGRVRVDGEVVTELGSRVVPGLQAVEVNGRRAELSPPAWLALHKPPGYVCTRDDPEGRPTIYDLLPGGEARHLFHVGRLDLMSEGLVLLTNEGDVAHRLLHPRYLTSRRYELVVREPLPPRLAERLLEGVELEDGLAAATEAAVLPGPKRGERRVRITLREGRNREIRRIMERLGVRICSLRRVAFGPVELGGLPPGRHRPLSMVELRELRATTASPEREDR